MKVNVVLFWILSLFFGILAPVYAWWTMVDYQNNPLSDVKNVLGVEWVGTVALTLACVLATFIAFYLQITWRAQRGELPEDTPTADIDDGDPEVGHFSPWSWWPMVLAAGLALMFLGFAVGIWIVFIGAPIVLLGVVGWQYEYFRNFFAR